MHIWIILISCESGFWCNLWHKEKPVSFRILIHTILMSYGTQQFLLSVSHTLKQKKISSILRASQECALLTLHQNCVQYFRKLLYIQFYRIQNYNITAQHSTFQHNTRYTLKKLLPFFAQFQPPNRFECIYPYTAPTQEAYSIYLYK